MVDITAEAAAAAAAGDGVVAGVDLGTAAPAVVGGVPVEGMVRAAVVAVLGFSVTAVAARWAAAAAVVAAAMWP